MPGLDLCNAVQRRWDVRLAILLSLTVYSCSVNAVSGVVIKKQTHIPLHSCFHSFTAFFLPSFITSDPIHPPPKSVIMYRSVLAVCLLATLASCDARSMLATKTMPASQVTAYLLHDPLLHLDLTTRHLTCHLYICMASPEHLCCLQVVANIKSITTASANLQ